MRTAVDTSVLLDVLGADPEFGASSREALRAAFDRGGLVACEVVWAEVRAHFADEEAFGDALDLLGVVYDPMTVEAARAAGASWRAYCRRHPRSRDRGRVVADFLVAAHALSRADALLARDRGFYRELFSDLDVIDPARHH